MLRELRGKSHHVHTGVCVFYDKDSIGDSSDKDNADDGDSNHPQQHHREIIQFVETSQVHFGGANRLTDALLEQYVASGEPLDKAGAYGYQGLACILVEKVSGCYYNIVGLPIFRLFHVLRELVAQKVVSDT